MKEQRMRVQEAQVASNRSSGTTEISYQAPAATAADSALLDWLEDCTDPDTVNEVIVLGFIPVAITSYVC